MNDSIRIIRAIASKDISDALKNKNTLTTIIMVALLMGMYQYLPTLWAGSTAEIVVFDPGQSSLTSALQNNPGYEIRAVATSEELIAFFDDGDEGDLALAIPANYDQILASGDTPTIKGYILWANRSNENKLVEKYEQNFEELTGVDVSIEIEEIVRPASNTMGAVRIISMIFFLIPLFIGTLAFPQTMLEEKRTKTLNVLMISPATVPQMIAGKAFVGMFYVAVASVVVLIFNRAYITNWGLVLASILLSGLFTVSMGLLFGIIFDNKQQLNTWTLIIFQPLLIPVFLSMIDPILPEKIRNALALIPTVTMTLLFRFSMTGGVEPGQTWFYLFIVGATTLLLLASVLVLVGRMDRMGFS